MAAGPTSVLCRAIAVKNPAKRAEHGGAQKQHHQQLEKHRLQRVIAHEPGILAHQENNHWSDEPGKNLQDVSQHAQCAFIARRLRQERGLGRLVNCIWRRQVGAANWKVAHIDSCSTAGCTPRIAAKPSVVVAAIGRRVPVPAAPGWECPLSRLPLWNRLRSRETSSRTVPISRAAMSWLVAVRTISVPPGVSRFCSAIRNSSAATGAMVAETIVPR